MLETDLFFKTEIKLYYDLYVPENAPERAPLLVAVHGYGAHKQYMMSETRRIAPENFVIASLQAPHPHFHPKGGEYKTRFGWLPEYKTGESIRIHHDFLREVIEKLESENVIDADKIYLYGFSQACALNFRFAFTYPERLRGVIGVCGGIPSDFEENEIYKPLKADVFYLYAKQDEFYPLEKYRDFKEKLKKRLNIFTSNEYDAKHEITDEMRADIKTWLAGR
jgi:phospholipase/carboxylesterase